MKRSTFLLLFYFEHNGRGFPPIPISLSLMGLSTAIGELRGSGPFVLLEMDLPEERIKLKIRLF